MQFKTLSILAAASTALAAPHQYSIQASIGLGATDLKSLQLYGNNIVYGLTQGYSDFRAEDESDIIKLFAEGYPGLSLDVSQNGELAFKSPSEPK
ncbi:YALI0A17963p [Yarrowia lipolytica CLIB122]|uniref:YALI0A17963p n=1 Tax=Yarrowia lipolytica (strain CLIB 122 / E 150) TaxID=284591 RepID=Q6CGM9_YARLI|nr:YALI0A17963p [Yarrowia lipolytica CLIB122]KAB8283383.1 hypothetical protein BKA91DRAFT_173421 [Yarrowia lipolytica]QNP95274.1 Hypothetical protein YALI2_A00273g [Yarrowia lipolytica]RMI95553.1 hypothetical protein BD777DRAFT_163001 [Yarrowia lipolytica]CAG84115.1 YALI0A17963p [Yarrowia lipolytica CLIB122]|eukprot:XP_500183.1 YALI0A17963p [Yarrowia lipolytica CLIB122]